MSMEPSPKPSVIPNRPRWPRWLAGLVFAVSAVLLLLGARGDLHIDEVVSLNAALDRTSWVAIFTEHQNDNTHLLNSLGLRALGWQSHFWVYRLPSVISCLGLLAVLALAARRFGPGTAIWVLVLAGLSFPIILYGSEARGYAPAMFFAVAAYELMQRRRERASRLNLVLFWACLVLGMLAQFTFLMVCLALGIWQLARDHFAGAGWRTRAGNVIKYFGVPLVCLAVLYVVFLRHMIILGGLVEPWWKALSDFATYLLGFAPDAWPLRVVAGLLMLGVLLGGLVKMFREKREEWVFWAAIFFVAPALVLLGMRPQFLYYRYFAVCFPFFYLLLGWLLARWFAGGGRFRWLAVAVLAAMVWGQGVKTAGLLRFGRGHYRQAMLDMAAATPGPVIRMCSDHDFRNGTLALFYAHFLPPGKTLVYIPRAKRDAEWPDWFVAGCMDPAFAAYPDIEVAGIGTYDRFGVYPYCGSSGLSWFVYRRPPGLVPPPAPRRLEAPPLAH